MENDQIVTLVAIVGAFILGGFFWWSVIHAQIRARELLHAERQAAIAKGLPPPEEPPGPPGAGGEKPVATVSTASNPLGTGLFWLFIGLGMIVAMRIVYPSSTSWGWGVIPVGVGLAYIVGVWLTYRLSSQKRGGPGRDGDAR